MQSTLHLAIPVLGALHKAWTSHSEKPKYTFFVPTLDAAAEKINEYYKKTSSSNAYNIAMCM
jgi:hypothetical protein